MSSKMIALLMLVALAAAAPQDEVIPESTALPPVLDIAMQLMTANSEDRTPCSFVTGEEGTCVPYFNCVDLSTPKGNGACNQLTVCCRPEFIFELPAAQEASSSSSSPVVDAESSPAPAEDAEPASPAEESLPEDSASAAEEA